MIKTKLEKLTCQSPWIVVGIRFLSCFALIVCTGLLIFVFHINLTLPPSVHNGYCAKISIQFNGGKLGVLTGTRRTVLDSNILLNIVFKLINYFNSPTNDYLLIWMHVGIGLLKTDLDSATHKEVTVTTCNTWPMHAQTSLNWETLRFSLPYALCVKLMNIYKHCYFEHFKIASKKKLKTGFP